MINELSFDGVFNGFNKEWEYRKNGLAPATKAAEDEERGNVLNHDVFWAERGGDVKAAFLGGGGMFGLVLGPALGVKCRHVARR